MSDKNRIVLEEISRKLTAMLESQAAMAQVPRQIAEIRSMLKTIKSDIEIIQTSLGITD